MAIIKVKYLIYILTILMTSDVVGQLTVDAGNDTIFCNGIESLSLGGDPTATGGQEPYQYKWRCLECGYFQNFKVYLSHLINDSTIANPVLGYTIPLNDTLLIELEIKDTEDKIAIDTIQIIISSIAFTHRVLYSPTILLGDTIEIHPVNIFNGIPPFNYSWTPDKALSDSKISNPLAFPDSTTVYKVDVVDAIGCEASDELKIIVEDTLSYLSKTSHNQGNKIFPNPTKDYIYIENEEFKPLRIKIYNISGELKIQQFVDDPDEKLSVDKLDPGIYIVEIINNEKRTSQQLIVY